MKNRASVKIQPLYKLSLQGRDLGLFTIQELAALQHRLSLLLKPRIRNDRMNPVKTFVADYASQADVTLAELTSALRTDRICLFRSIAMVLALELIPDATLEEVGAAFNRDHTTVINARNSLADRLSTNRNDKALFEDLRARMIKHLTPSFTSLPSVKIS